MMFNREVIKWVSQCKETKKIEDVQGDSGDVFLLVGSKRKDDDGAVHNKR